MISALEIDGSAPSDPSTRPRSQLPSTPPSPEISQGEGEKTLGRKVRVFGEKVNPRCSEETTGGFRRRNPMPAEWLQVVLGVWTCGGNRDNDDKKKKKTRHEACVESGTSAPLRGPMNFIH